MLRCCVYVLHVYVLRVYASVYYVCFLPLLFLYTYVVFIVVLPAWLSSCFTDMTTVLCLVFVLFFFTAALCVNVNVQSPFMGSACF